jgi:hypothetical protein
MNFIFKAQIKKILLAFLNFVIYSTGWMYLNIDIGLGRFLPAICASVLKTGKPL